jgi:1-deoxy-D-xylulose-5-phosphate reductoisomerase
MQKRILIQGATGSIGQSVAAIAREQSAQVAVCGLATNSNVELLLELAREFRVTSLAVRAESGAEAVYAAAKSRGIERVYVGADACREQAASEEYDILVNALMGSVGIEPTLTALARGKRVALANKETLVAAGPLVLALARESGAEIIPIDSEHSAIFQCLRGEDIARVRTIWLTTSGGPFWGRDWNSLDDVTPARALAHPTWKMGPKITVDSATLFNKGLEVIETQRLFGVQPEQIKVVTHRQSIVHSLVEFVDGSFKAQLSTPDMRLPILYALSYPDRFVSAQVRTDLCGTAWTFEPVESGMFPLLDLAISALARGGTVPAAVSAADEVAVGAFLDGRIGFTDIAAAVSRVLADGPEGALNTWDDVRVADLRARELCNEFVGQRRTMRTRVA